MEMEVLINSCCVSCEHKSWMFPLVWSYAFKPNNFEKKHFFQELRHIVLLLFFLLDVYRSCLFDRKLTLIFPIDLSDPWVHRRCPRLEVTSPGQRQTQKNCGFKTYETITLPPSVLYIFSSSSSSSSSSPVFPRVCDWLGSRRKETTVTNCTD